MKRRTTSARAVAAAARAAVSLESLELRRLLSTTYEIANTLTDTDGGYGYANFGRGLATQGNLALIASPGQTASITFDGGNTYQEIDTTAGRVSLVDTTDGSVLHTFNNPIANPDTGSLFGASVAFVDGKIAISAPGSVSVYIYDNWDDDIPDQTYTYGTDPFVIYGSSMAVHGDDLLVSVLQANPSTNNGAILRYDLDSSDTDPAATFYNPDPGVTDNDQFGSALASNGTNIFAKAIVNGESEVIAMDGSGNLVQTYHGQPGDYVFGIALATSGGNLIIGSPTDSAAFQVDLGGNLLQTYAIPAGRQTVGAFASALAVNGGKLLVGDQYNLSPLDESTVYQSGAAYVYDLSTGDLEATIENEASPTSLNEDLADYWDSFGIAVASLPDGKFLVAASNANNANGIDAGTVYVYEEAIVANSPPTADAGAAQTITEGQAATLDAGASSDPDGAADIVDYLWDLDNDGQYDDASGVSVPFTPDLSGSYIIGLKVVDSASNEATASTTVSVTDIAPGASAGANQTVLVNDPVNVSGAGVSAPGDAITYEWDFDYDGSPANFSADASGANASTSYATAGTRTVALRVSDDDGQSAISTLTVIVNSPPPANSAPSALAIAGQAAAVRLQNVSFTGSFTDADLGDTHTVAWDFGDGNVIAAHATTDAGALAVSHAYAAAGVYTVTMTVTDNLNASTSTTFDVTVTATGVQGGVFYVGGTGGSDTVNITQSGSTKTVTIGGASTAYTGGSIVIYCGNGNDIVLVAGNVNATIEAHGGAGTDILSGGGGPSILVGDAGSDLITGGGGRDLLIGGTGSDIILGNADSDILISGATVHDNNSSALAAILAAWNSSDSYTIRVNSLRAVGGLLTPDQDVFDDAAIDILSGGSGTDWFIFNNDSGVRDFVVDRTAAELQTDIDALLSTV